MQEKLRLKTVEFVRLQTKADEATAAAAKAKATLDEAEDELERRTLEVAHLLRELADQEFIGEYFFESVIDGVSSDRIAVSAACVCGFLCLSCMQHPSLALLPSGVWLLQRDGDKSLNRM